MNYTDYENWADEYRQQVEILNRKLEGRHRSRRFATAEDRQIFEHSTRILEDMRRDCVRTLAILDQKAREIKEAEQYEKRENIVA